ncbi:MAG: hypothetical protein Q4D02_06565 [Clostridia bacterium]|nr:hypothetical protein [Clostridia bacterium]
MNWNFKKRLFEIFRNYEMDKALARGEILTYEEELIQRLRHVYYGFLPASALLLIDDYCNGYCADRSMLITMGMDDFKLVRADVRSLAINYGREHAYHSFVEHDGYVYDTSLGCKIKKEVYYKIENPRIRKIDTMKECMCFPEYRAILHTDIQNEKMFLPVTMPMIMEAIQRATFKERATYELELFKQEIEYDKMLQESMED